MVTAIGFYSRERCSLATGAFGGAFGDRTIPDTARCGPPTAPPVHSGARSGMNLGGWIRTRETRSCGTHHRRAAGVADLTLRPRNKDPADQRGGAGTWSPTTIHNISPAAFHILRWQPRAAQYRGLPTHAHSATIPVAEALMSRYRESGAVAVRPMSEVHLRLSLARPVALDPIVTVREAGRFTLINTSSGLLKLTNADSERRRLVQRPGLCLCRRD